MAESEQDIQKQIIDWLQALQIWVRKVPVGPMLVGNRRSVPNPLKFFPDLLVCHYGRFVVIEVKKPGATTTKARAEGQAEIREEIRAAGGIAEVVTSMAEVQAIIWRIEREEVGG